MNQMNHFDNTCKETIELCGTWNPNRGDPHPLGGGGLYPGRGEGKEPGGERAKVDMDL